MNVLWNWDGYGRKLTIVHRHRRRVKALMPHQHTIHADAGPDNCGGIYFEGEKDTCLAGTSSGCVQTTGTG